jgi:hypothetical protein
MYVCHIATGAKDRGETMTGTQKFIIGIIVAIIAIVLLAATTPEECNVDVSEMSAACKSLLFS